VKNDDRQKKKAQEQTPRTESNHTEAVILSILRMLQKMMAMMVRMVLAGMLMAFMGMGAMTVRLVAVAASLVMVARQTVGMGFARMVSNGFMMMSRMMTFVVGLIGVV
jgi:uncharacterized membrane protein